MMRWIYRLAKQPITKLREHIQQTLTTPRLASFLSQEHHNMQVDIHYIIRTREHTCRRLKRQSRIPQSPSQYKHSKFNPYVHNVFVNLVEWKYPFCPFLMAFTTSFTPRFNCLVEAAAEEKQATIQLRTKICSDTFQSSKMLLMILRSQAISGILLAAMCLTQSLY